MAAAQMHLGLRGGIGQRGKAHKQGRAFDGMRKAKGRLHIIPGRG